MMWIQLIHASLTAVCILFGLHIRWMLLYISVIYCTCLHVSHCIFFSLSVRGSVSLIFGVVLQLFQYFLVGPCYSLFIFSVLLQLFFLSYSSHCVHFILQSSISFSITYVYQFSVPPCLVALFSFSFYFPKSLSIFLEFHSI
jgi:hypothetical protein